MRIKWRLWRLAVQATWTAVLACAAVNGAEGTGHLTAGAQNIQHPEARGEQAAGLVGRRPTPTLTVCMADH